MATDETTADLLKFAIGGREIMKAVAQAKQEQQAEQVESVKLATKSLGRRVRRARARIATNAARAGSSLADTLAGLDALEEAQQAALEDEVDEDDAQQPEPDAPAAPSWELDPSPKHSAAWKRANDFLIATDKGLAAPAPPAAPTLVQLAAFSVQRVRDRAVELMGGGKDADSSAAMLRVPRSMVDRVSGRWRMAQAVGMRTDQPAAALAAAIGLQRWLGSAMQLRAALAAARQAASLAEAISASSSDEEQQEGARRLGAGALREAAKHHDSLGEPAAAARLRRSAAQLEAGKALDEGHAADDNEAERSESAASNTEQASASSASDTEQASASSASSKSASADGEPSTTASSSSLTMLALAGQWAALEATLQAAEAGDEAAITALLLPDNRGTTVLMAAAASAPLPLLRRLLACGGGDAAARDSNGGTAVWWAINLRGGVDGYAAAVAVAQHVHPGLRWPPWSSTVAPGSTAVPSPVAPHHLATLLPPPSSPAAAPAAHTAALSPTAPAAGPPPVSPAAADLTARFVGFCTAPRCLPPQGHIGGRSGGQASATEALRAAAAASLKKHQE